MNISYGERLILKMLCDLYEHLGVHGEINHKVVAEAITSGNTWSLDWDVLSDVEDPSAAVVKETGEIMTMWSVIEREYADLKQADKDQLKKDLGLVQDPRFEGFDGNNDAHFGVAKHLVEQMGRFDNFSRRDLNSHSAVSLPRYRSMLPKYNAVALRNHGRVTGQDLSEILSR